MTQDEALAILKAGANVFLTGEPGAGKTHTVNQYVAYLRAHGIEPAITASTGIAATHVGGMTIHSWSGIGVREHATPGELTKITKVRGVATRVKKTKVLIIDEISMLGAATFDLVERVCRKVRGSDEPFGGLQVVVVGDFFQLPPVTRRGDTPTFAFQGESWGRIPWAVCYLSEQHRQDDGDFLMLLAAIRAGQVEPEHIAHVERRLIGVRPIPEGITQLFPHNMDVDRINDEALAELPDEPIVYMMHAVGPDRLVETLRKNCLSPEMLRLKRDAVVMFTKNHPQGRFVNGTLGRVEGFESGSEYPIIRTLDGRRIEAYPMEWVIEEDGEPVASIEQLPLRLAWAMTVHKSQGMSLDAAVIDLRRSFEFGQGYVALSRVRRLSGLHLLGYNQRTFEVHPVILTQDQYFRERSASMARAVQVLTPAELEEKWERFIRHCGGKMPVTETREIGDEKQPQSGSPQATLTSAYAERLERLREKYPNAYRPWSAELDATLTQFFQAEMGLAEIGQEMGRRRGSIRARLIKLGLIDRQGQRLGQREG